MNGERIAISELHNLNYCIWQKGCVCVQEKKMISTDCNGLLFHILERGVYVYDSDIGEVQL
jgi:deoxycytidylate deaminase